MSATLLSYVWHYLVARALYDELLRPLMRGNVLALSILISVGVAALLAGRWTRHRTKWGRE